MGVTISRAAERRSQPPRWSGRRRLAGLAGGAERGREAALLTLAAVVVLLAMVLTWRTVAPPLAEFPAQLARGEVIDLNDERDAGGGGAGGVRSLAAQLSFLPGAQERAFVADRIRQRLAAGPVDNVGELGRLRVQAGEVDAHALPDLAARLAAAQRDRVALLAPAQLRQLKPHLVVRTAAQYRSGFLRAAALLLAGFALAHLVLRFRRFAGDQLLLPILLLLCGLGFVLMVTLRDPLRDLPLHERFAYGALAGCGLFVAGALIDVERTVLARRGLWALVAAALLSALLIVFGGGPGASDAKVNLLGVQPVELIKILIALFLAHYLADRWELLREVPERRAPLRGAARLLALPRLEYVIPPLVAIGLILFFFFLQKDLGPALVLASLFLILYSVARGRAGMALVGVVMVGVAFATAYRLGYPRTVGQRIGMWLSPWDTWFHGGDHLAQAIWSLAAGGATGTGLGLGEPGLVPEAHTDLVLSAVGEQLGFVGLAAVTALYVLLTQRGLRAARRAASPYAFFLALGFTLLLALETVVIAGGVLGLLPLSGVTTPFLSSGRSAMLANFLVAGVLAGIAARPAAQTAAAGAGAPGGAGMAGGGASGPGLSPFLGGLRWVAVGLGVFAALALARVADFQVIHADRYLTRGAVVLQGDGVRRYQYNPRLAAIAASIPRGSIVDRNGVLLAASDAAVLEQQRQQLMRLGASESDLPAAGAGGAGPVLAAGTPAGAVRFYPFGGRTFHLLGDLRNRVNWKARNNSFIERDARIRLQGYDDYAGVRWVPQPGYRGPAPAAAERGGPAPAADHQGESPQVIVDYRELVPLLRHRYEPDDPRVKRLLASDRTVRMTIDVRLQLAAEDILRQAAAKAGYGAAAVVLDAATGDLLAAASYPYPATLPATPAPATPGSGEEAGGGLLDRARYGIYPPGSTFKVVTAMAALRKDPGLASRTYECKLLPDGRVGNRVQGRTVRDDPTDRTPHGTVNLDKGIRVSCNAFFAQLAALAVGPRPLFETARILGIQVARPNTPEQLAKALPQAAFGQGQVIATPFQMARVAAAIAAGGRMPEGRWLLGDENPRTGAPAPVLDAAATAILAHAMRGVVTDGTAKAFLRDVQPPIAGKTGTAEVQDSQSHSWFIGFAPYAGTGRRIAVAVVVEHGGYGGRLAAPAAGEIVRRAAALGLLRQEAEEGRTGG